MVSLVWDVSKIGEKGIFHIHDFGFGNKKALCGVELEALNKMTSRGSVEEDTECEVCWKVYESGAKVCALTIIRDIGGTINKEQIIIWDDIDKIRKMLENPPPTIILQTGSKSERTVLLGNPNILGWELSL